MCNKFTNKEYINIYSNYKSLCSNMVSQIVNYESWSDEFCRDEVNGLYDKLIFEFKDIDFTVFTEVDLQILDFKMWDENIILAPMWSLDCLPKGTEMISINGEKITVGEEKLDNDIRMGVTAYGFSRNQLRNSKIEEVLEK